MDSDNKNRTKIIIALVNNAKSENATNDIKTKIVAIEKATPY